MNRVATVARLLRAGTIARAAGATPSGVMVAFALPPYVAANLWLQAVDALGTRLATPQHELHLTLAFLGRADDLADPEGLRAVVASIAATTPALDGAINGFGQFIGVDAAGDPWWAHADIPALPAFRTRLLAALGNAGFAASETHGFTAHITLGYLPPDTTTTALRLRGLPLPVRFERLVCAIAGEWTEYPFAGLVERGGYLPRRKRQDTPTAVLAHRRRLDPEWDPEDAPDSADQQSGADRMRRIVALAGPALYAALRAGRGGAVTQLQRENVAEALSLAGQQYGAEAATPARVDAYASASLSNLRSIADRLADGEISDAQAASWTAYEANVAFHAYEAERHALARERGLTAAAWILDPTVKQHCAGCLALADGSPYTLDTLPTLPGAGDTDCDDGCCCDVEYSGGPDDAGDDEGDDAAD